MIDELRALTSVIKCHRVNIDSWIFRLHCRLTTICLIVALVIVCTTQFVSRPIFCDMPRGKVNTELLDAHCYMHSTYRIVKWYYLEDSAEAMAARANHSNDGVLEPYAGVRPQYPGQFMEADGQNNAFTRTYRIDYTYFNWIWVIYFLMAIGFYCPNWIWKQLEGGRMKILIGKIDFFDKEKGEMVDKAMLSNNLALFSQYMDHAFGNFGSYMRCYFFCELLAVGNIAGQMFLLNQVLHGRWYLYGYEVVALYWSGHFIPAHANEDVNPMVMLFPKQTKCEYRRFGPSGNLDEMDALCMMPLNNFNDKFFLLLWFWMTFLCLLFVLNTVYRIVQYSVPYLRFRAIKSMIVYELDTKDIFKSDLRRLIEQINMADWFVLYHMGTNLDPLNYYEAIASVIQYRHNKRSTVEQQRGDQSVSKYINDVQEIA